MKTGRKISGGKYTTRRKKKAYEIQGQKRVVKLGEDKRKTLRVKGGNKKIVMLKGKTMNIEGKKTQIKNVVETPSNKFLARQNIITKGTIVDTEMGKAKVTNRPSQEGTISGILLKE